MAAYNNPFLDPNFVLNPDFALNRVKLNDPLQSAPQPEPPQPQPQQQQQPQQPQLPPGIGDFLASLGQAYQNQGLAAPGHGRNQTIQDRAKLEGATAAQQRTTFNEAFPRGRGADGLMPIPKFDPQLAYSKYAERRAGGGPRWMFGDSNLKVNQPQVGFMRLPGKTPDGGPRLESVEAPPLSLGGVLTTEYQAPAYTGRGGDFYDKATGTTSGLINYNAPDSEKYKAGNVWTARGSVTQAPPPAPVAPPALSMSELGDYLAQHGATSPMSETRLGLPQPPAPRLPFESPSAPPSYSDTSQPAQPEPTEVPPPVPPATPPATPPAPAPVDRSWPHTQYSDDLWNHMKALPPGARPAGLFAWANGVGAEGLKDLWNYLSTPPPRQ